MEQERNISLIKSMIRSCSVPKIVNITIKDSFKIIKKLIEFIADDNTLQRKRRKDIRLFMRRLEMIAKKKKTLIKGPITGNRGRRSGQSNGSSPNDDNSPENDSFRQRK